MASLLVVSANAQNNNPTTQCLTVANAQCNSPIENFNTDPAAKGYTFNNLAWLVNGPNTRLGTTTATGGNTFTVTTPSFYTFTFGSLTVGFSVATRSGAFLINLNPYCLTILIVSARPVVVS